MTEMLDLLTYLRAATWLDRAACSLTDSTDLDQPIGAAPSPIELETATFAAALLCAHCPVAGICAAEADRTKGLGVRGGSLRYVNKVGRYVAEPLVSEAVRSPFEHVVRGRLARRRARINEARIAGVGS